MSKTMARLTFTRTKTYTVTLDFPSYGTAGANLSDANIRAAAIAAGGVLSNGEVLAITPGANGVIAVTGTDWATSARDNIEPYSTWLPSTAYSTAGVKVAPTALTNRTYIVKNGATGTSGSTEPTWSTAIGSETVSGTVTFVAIDKFFTAVTFATTTAFTKGQVVYPVAYTTHRYVVTVGGTTSTTPSWSASPAIGATLTSGECTFVCIQGAS